MRFTRPFHVLAALALAACSSATESDGAALTALPDFQTDSVAYTLRSTDVGYEGTIGVRFTNRTSTTANFVNCRGGTGVELQKLVDNTWTSAWSPALLACLSAPIVVAPGGTHQSIISIFAGYKGSNYFPQFNITDIPGVYRAVWTEVVTDYQDRLPFGNPLPLEHRVSNQFTISVKPK
jgi:hypothetical protein